MESLLLRVSVFGTGRYSVVPREKSTCRHIWKMFDLQCCFAWKMLEQWWKKFARVTNLCLIWFKTHATRWNQYLALQGWHILRVNNPGTFGKIKCYYSPKENSNKCTPCGILLYSYVSVLLSHHLPARTWNQL